MMGVGDHLFGGDYDSEKARLYARRRTELRLHNELSRSAGSLDDATRLQTLSPYALHGVEAFFLGLLVKGGTAAHSVDGLLVGVPYTTMSIVRREGGRYVISHGRNIEAHLGREIEPDSLADRAIKEASPKISGRTEYEPRTPEKGDSFMVFPIINGEEVLGALNVAGNGFTNAHYLKGKASAGIVGHCFRHAGNDYGEKESHLAPQYGDKFLALSGLSALYRRESTPEKALIGEIADLFAYHLSNGSPTILKDDIVRLLSFSEQDNIYAELRETTFYFVKVVAENPRAWGLSSPEHIERFAKLAENVKVFEAAEQERAREIEIIKSRFSGENRSRWSRESWSSTLGG